jgi:hypothetical protein
MWSSAGFSGSKVRSSTAARPAERKHRPASHGLGPLQGLCGADVRADEFGGDPLGGLAFGVVRQLHAERRQAVSERLGRKRSVIWL